MFAGPGSLVRCISDWYSGRGFNPPVLQHSFMEIGHEIISTAILATAYSRKAVFSYWQKDVH